MGTTTDVYFDPYDVDINADPYPVYERLREDAPAYRNDRYDFWALSRHADVERALQDGYSTGSGLGLGLGGAKRLSNEFHIDSRPGEGTRITIARWR